MGYFELKTAIFCEMWLVCIVYILSFSQMHIHKHECFFFLALETLRNDICPVRQWPGCFHRGGQEGPTSLWWHRNLHYFNIRNSLFDYPVLVPKTQLKTIHLYVIQNL